MSWKQKTWQERQAFEEQTRGAAALKILGEKQYAEFIRRVRNARNQWRLTSWYAGLMAEVAAATGLPFEGPADSSEAYFLAPSPDDPPPPPGDENGNEIPDFNDPEFWFPQGAYETNLWTLSVRAGHETGVLEYLGEFFKHQKAWMSSCDFSDFMGVLDTFAEPGMRFVVNSGDPITRADYVASE